MNHLKAKAMQNTLHLPLAAWMVCGLLASCQNFLDEVVSDDAECSQIVVQVSPNIWNEANTRSDGTTQTQAPAFPIHYYLYNQSTRTFVNESVITEGTNTDATFTVAKGSYVVYAVTGVTAVEYKNASLSTAFTFDPAASGVGDFCLGSTSTITVNGYYQKTDTTTIHAQHVFGKLSIAIANVPSDVDSIEAKVDTVYNSIGWTGQYGTTTSSRTLKFSRETSSATTSSTWTAEGYLYPSTGKLAIALKVFYSDKSEQTLYTATSNSIQAGKQLSLTTQFSSMHSSNVNIVTDVWETPISEEISIGSGTEASTEKVETSDANPTSNVVFGTQYKNGYAIIVGLTEGQTQMLIMGTNTTTYSSFNSSAYASKDGIEDAITWTIPTKTQWNQILDACNHSLETFNTTVLATGVATSNKMDKAMTYAVRNTSTNAVEYYSPSDDKYTTEASDDTYVFLYPVAIVATTTGSN
jgi:hypothetical protein